MELSHLGTPNMMARELHIKGQSVKNLTADEYGSIYLYAQWKTTHTVHFRAYNATPEYFEDQRVADGDSATKPTDPVRPGFVFRDGPQAIVMTRHCTISALR